MGLARILILFRNIVIVQITTPGVQSKRDNHVGIWDLDRPPHRKQLAVTGDMGLLLVMSIFHYLHIMFG